MADGYTLRIVSNKLELDKAELLQAADAIVQKTGADIQAEMQSHAPVLTGYMRDHIELEKIGPAHARITAQADYTPFVVYGTRFMAPRDFWNPPIDHQWNVMIDAFRQLQAIFG